MKGFRRFVLWFCCLGSVGLTALPVLAWIDPRLVIAQAFALQLGAGSLALAFLAVIARRWLVTLLCLIAALWNAMLVGPALLHAPESVAPSPVLKVISLNVQFDNPDPARIRDYLLKSDADVVGLVEMTPRIKAALEPSTAAYPYRVDCLDADPSCDVMLLSKHPFKEPFAGVVDQEYTHVAAATIDWQNRPVGIVVTHLSWPFIKADAPVLVATTRPGDAAPSFPGAPRLQQTMQMAGLAQYLPHFPNDLVLMGDFNSVAWSTGQADFRMVTGLENRGHIALTWPSLLPWPLRIPIDQVFTGGKLTAYRVAPGPDVGSDHLPVTAEITLKP
ncbi:MAG TPA: endonuclease/exonuclease/phosphatase family protein [Dongiaceae bacterium]